VKDVLGLGNEHLEFYDIRYSLWVLCSPSYPHDVKKDCRLLLRRPGVICTGFETHLEHATEKPIHMRFNMAGERAAIKVQLQHRRTTAASPISVIELSDDDDDELVIKPVCRVPMKRRHDESESDEVRPSQRLRNHSHHTPTSIFSPSSPTTSPFRLSSSPPLSFPWSPLASPPPRNQKVLTPLTGKWPAGMYTCDMKLAFEQVGSKALKQMYPLLPARLAFVLGDPFMSTRGVTRCPCGPRRPLNDNEMNTLLKAVWTRVYGQLFVKQYGRNFYHCLLCISTRTVCISYYHRYVSIFVM